ncbi:hypothetical protein ACI2JA_03280 [Alkalihalobacillus sp. NPDC078783]
MTEKHFKGFVYLDFEGNACLEKNYTLSETIASELDWDGDSNHVDDIDSVEVSVRKENVSVRLYASDTEKTLEELIEGVVLTTMGALDIYSEWYGWSDWTKDGYDLKNFTIGNHDLNEILKSYEGKYVHMVFEY